MSKTPTLLLTGAFKPFAVDNIYSRKESIPELFHNQITHFQGIYSPRIHYPTYGLHLIAANVPADVTVLDFPTWPRFIAEIKKGYDYVGIGSIIPNFYKVKRMAEAVREHAPKSRIIIGGFCAMLPDLARTVEVDHVCVGEGIGFVRELLGFSRDFTFVHPDVGNRTIQVLGIPINSYLPCLVTALGCNRGCDFCSTTHFFGQKHHILLDTGEDVFREMVRLERRYKTVAMGLVGDDNFFAHVSRARQLRDLMVKHEKPYSYGTFGSADALLQFEPKQIAEMGVDTLWIGRESKFQPYAKNADADMKSLVEGLGQWGVRVILSSILLLDCHTPENIKEEIDDHIAARPAFSQFAHLSPVPGTPLYERLQKEQRILDGIPYEECHAFRQPWFFHPRFSLHQAEKIQRDAYLKEFYELGPGLARLIHTTLRGYLSFKGSGSPPLEKRAGLIEKRMWFYKSALYDMELLAPDAKLRGVIQDIRKDVERMVGRLTAFEKSVAMAAFTVGAARRASNGVFGDVLQPETTYHRYPADWKRDQ
ncbi:MAG: B12-binding domain-containing radical SAM protein [Thermodesulfobacteriota bacterium]